MYIVISVAANLLNVVFYIRAEVVAFFSTQIN